MADTKEFFEAVYRGQAGRIPLLVAEFGMADGSDGVLAFRTAVQRGDEGCITAFLNAASNSNVRDPDGATPLIWAAQSEQLTIARTLLNHGARPDDRDDVGWTALFYAALAQNPDIARLLLNHGADTTIRDNEGRTAYDWARFARFRCRIPILGELSGIRPMLRASTTRQLLHP